MYNTPTVSKVITAGLSKELTHSHVHMKTAYVGEDDIRRIYNWDSIIDKYRDLLLAETYEIELNDKEMEQYRFRSRMYCYDIYNNADLWSILLRLNNMTTDLDFNRKKFRSFGSNFIKVLNEIMTIEYDKLNESLLNAKLTEKKN